MFKRRTPKTYGQWARGFLWPQGGWRRSATYVLHRMRRLPDQPHRVARGFACGIFISFTPLFGFHLFGGAALAWLFGGNIIAALFGTLIGNPVTIPVIAALSVGLGRKMLGVEGSLSPQRILHEFTRATGELTHNFYAIFTDEVAHWDSLRHFYDVIFLPYLVGGLIPGLIAAIIGHYLTVPVIRAYHRRRAGKMAERIAALQALSDARAEGRAEEARATPAPPPLQPDPGAPPREDEPS